jgi:hypothetical protein
MTNMHSLGLQQKKFILKNRGSTSLNLWCHNYSITEWRIIVCSWNSFSVVWYSEKRFLELDLLLQWPPAVACEERKRELQNPKPCVIFRIPGNWQSRCKVRVIPSVNYHANKSLLEVKWLNYSLPNVRSFLSNLIYQSSLALLNCSPAS